MRISTRLILIGTVAACAPMLPEPPLPSMPQPETSQPMTPTTQPPATTPSATESVPDQAGFDGWKQGFLDRHAGPSTSVNWPGWAPIPPSSGWTATNRNSRAQPAPMSRMP